MASSLKTFLCELETSWTIFSVPYNCSQSCLALWDPVDQRGSSVHGFSQVRILEWAAVASPGDLPDPGIDRLLICLALWQAGSLARAPRGEPFLCFSAHHSALFSPALIAGLCAHCRQSSFLFLLLGLSFHYFVVVLFLPSLEFFLLLSFLFLFFFEQEEGVGRRAWCRWIFFFLSPFFTLE